ncbi:MAG: DUF5696 domain-containing protein [Defluviitaleaceae bacterium]|nr:DUF5696 domain-containing protein [Defluviitaleaceae bacterium]
MKKLFSLAAVLTLAFVFTGCATRERYGGYVQIFGGQENVPPVVNIQNEYLRLDFYTETAQIILTELATGNTWRSTPEDIAYCPQTVTIERNNAQSLFILEFQDRVGTGRPFTSYRYSVNTGRFEHEIIGNTLELRFTVGDIVQTFYVPDAIYGHRIREFLAELTRSQGNRILNEFTPISLERARNASEREEWLAQFPTLEYGHTIYVLDDEVPAFRLEFVQDSLREAGYTYEDWVNDMAYFNVQTYITQPAFNVIKRFELDRNSMVVTVPIGEITYVPDYKPTALHILPFFGAGHFEDEGYLFIPDGSGSILYFDSGRYTQDAFGSRMYGWDEAIVRESVLHDNRAAYPVFGIYRNGKTHAAIIDEGASYVLMRAYVAGIRTPYSRVIPVFRLLHGTSLDVQGRSNDSLMMHEWDLPDENIVIRYVIPRGDGYVGMAHAYRDFLQERYPWLSDRVDEPVNAMVEILGSALTRQHFLGIPTERPFALTTYDQAADMMQTLADFGWTNLHVKMRGAHNDSIDHIVPTSLDLIRQLGGRSGFNNMVTTAERLGFEFYIEGDFFRMRGDALFDGFSPMRDAARQANRERASHHGYSFLYFGEHGSGHTWADEVIFARPEFTIQIANNFVQEAAGRGVNNIAFRCMASSLTGDFNEDRHVTREASMNMRVDFLAGLHNDTGIWLNYGFAYGAPFADVITGMPLTDQGFGITDVAVPFYQIALHGLIPFAGRPINLAEDYSYHFLKSIESGASLFFSFMDVPTADLNVTRYRRYFSNEFRRWADEANRHYHNQLQNFGHLYNQFIVDHQILNRVGGVTVTVYEDNTRVYVNTTLNDFVTDTGVTLLARSYEVRR